MLHAKSQKSKTSNTCGERVGVRDLSRLSAEQKEKTAPKGCADIGLHANEDEAEGRRALGRAVQNVQAPRACRSSWLWAWRLFNVLQTLYSKAARRHDRYAQELFSREVHCRSLAIARTQCNELHGTTNGKKESKKSCKALVN